MPPWRTMLRPIFRKARLLVMRLGAFFVLPRDISMRVFTQSAGMLVMQAAAPDMAPACQDSLLSMLAVVRRSYQECLVAAHHQRHGCSQYRAAKIFWSTLNFHSCRLACSSRWCS